MNPIRTFFAEFRAAHGRLFTTLALWVAFLLFAPPTGLLGAPMAAYNGAGGETGGEQGGEGGERGNGSALVDPKPASQESDATWGLDADAGPGAPPGRTNEGLPSLERTPEQLAHETKIVIMLGTKFSQGMSKWGELRKNAAYDDKFVLGQNQWNDIAKALRKGRPMPTVNKTHLAFHQIVNDFAQNLPAPDIGPDDDEAHVDVARVLMGLWRYTNKRSQGNAHRLLGFAQAVSGGWGYWKVGMRYANDRDFQLETVVEPVPDRLSIVDDMGALLPAGADRSYLFEVGKIRRADAEVEYPYNRWESCSADVAGAEQAALWSGGEDRPLITAWWRRIRGFKSVTDQMQITEKARDGMPAKAKARTRQVAEYEVLWCKTNGAEVLYDRAGNCCRGTFPSQYIPYCRTDGWKMWVDGKWHLEGNVRQAIDAQELNNYAEAGVAEFISLAPKAPFMGPAKAIAAYKQIWDTANTAPWSFLPYDVVMGEGGVPLKPERVEPPAPPVALLQMRENQGQNLRETLGMFQASTGQSQNDESGYARAQVRSENDTNHYHFATGFAEALQHEVTILIDLWANLYKNKTVLRILGEDDVSVQRVTVNEEQPVPGQKSAMWTTYDTQKNPVPHYDLRVGRYGVTVKLGPSFATQMEQTKATYDTLLGRLTPQQAALLAPFYVKATNVPDADKVFNVLVAALPPELQSLYRDDPEGMDDKATARALKSIVAQTMPMVKQQQQMIQMLQGKVNDKQMELGLKAVAEANKVFSARLDTIGKVTATQMSSEASIIKEGMKADKAREAAIGAANLDATADEARSAASSPQTPNQGT